MPYSDPITSVSNKKTMEELVSQSKLYLPEYPFVELKGNNVLLAPGLIVCIVLVCSLLLVYMDDKTLYFTATRTSFHFVCLGSIF